jgi:WD40 repeat protein
MSSWQGTLWGFLCIATVVIVGMLHANDPDMQRWQLSPATTDELTRRPAPQICVNRVDWSADGKLLLSRSRSGANAQGQLALHDVTRQNIGLPIALMDDLIGAAMLAPDGRHVLVGSVHGRLLWLPVDRSYDPTVVLELPGDAVFTAAAVTGDGRRLAGGTRAGRIYLCAPELETCITLTTSTTSAVVDLNFSRDGTRLVVGHGDGLVCVCDVTTGTLLQEFVGHEQPTRARFLPDGKRIISAGFDDTVRIWEIAHGQELWRKEFPLFRINALTVSADGSKAAWGGSVRKIVIWDLKHNRTKREIATPAAILDLQFSPDDALCACAGMDETIRLYDVLSGSQSSTIEIDTWPKSREGL